MIVRWRAIECASRSGAEATFERDIERWEEVVPAVESLAAKVWAACDRGGNSGRTVTVKIK